MIRLRLDFFVLGYRKIKISRDNIPYVSSLLARASLPSKILPSGEIFAREKDIEKIKDLISGRIEFNISEPKGLYGIFEKTKHKFTIFLALASSLFLISFLSELVWDIRVEGNVAVNEFEIIEVLRESGFQVGDLWRRVDMSKVEAEVLSRNDSLSWININRRGSVAYVKVMEKENNENPSAESDMKYCNIVAERDCVIEEITVKKGRALVKVGDAVRRGEILVLGIGPDESGGNLCAAEATVIGRVNDSVRVFVDRKSELKSYDKAKISYLSINLFKISINIFKKYGNLTSECAIIENEIEYALPGEKRLPLSITVKYTLDKSILYYEYSDEELISIASKKLNDATLSLLSNSDLLKIRTYGSFSDDGYSMANDLVFLTPVGRCVEFKVD